MPNPIYAPGTIGDALPRQSLPPGRSCASLLDLATSEDGGQAGDVEALVVAKAVLPPPPPGGAPIALPEFDAYPAYATPATIRSATPTTLVVAGDAANDIDPGQRVLLCKSDPSRLGETAAVASVSAAAPGSAALTLAAPTRLSYAAGDRLWLFCGGRGLSFPVAPGSPGEPAYARVNLATGRWCLEVRNLDPAAPIVAVATADRLCGYG